MIPEVPYPSRIPIGATEEIQRATQIRDAAARLKDLAASRGRYLHDELEQFWRLVETAGLALRASNMELGERAGLRPGYFLSVARKRQRPHLDRYLMALTGIIATANERLFDVEHATAPRQLPGQDAESTARLSVERDYAELLVLSRSLALMARDEIGRIDNERPNDPLAIERNRKDRELLLKLAEGFDRIEAALSAVVEGPAEPLRVRKASNVVKSVGREIEAWFEKNGSEVVDSTMRISQIAAGVMILNLAGAEMKIATSVVAALVGGKKIVELFKGKKPKHD